MIKITERINSGEKLISDGAWGTELHKKGLKLGDCPESWNLDHRSDVLEIATSYVEAGADMIETNSFGGSRINLEQFGLGDRTVLINRTAAEISREAAGNSIHVLGSIGPTGKMLLMEDVTLDDLHRTYSEQAAALESGGADAIVVETMFDLEEAKSAVRSARESTRCEIICTMTFDGNEQSGFHTMMGTRPDEAASALIEAGADIIGANCGNGIETMIGIVRELRKVSNTIPIMIQANAGLPLTVDGHIVYPQSPEDTSRWIVPLIEAGADIIGGCCGTTPLHIRKIAEIIKSRRR